MQVGLPFSFADIAAARDRIALVAARAPGPHTRLGSDVVDVQVETADRWHPDAVLSALEACGFLLMAVD